MVEILTRKYAVPEYVITKPQFIDLTGDKYPDLVFTIEAGFSLLPRKIYCLDIVNRNLIKSPEYGIVINSLQFTDLNNDGFLEIVGNCVASGNVEDSLGFPYDDYSSWVMIYDHTLQLLFEPVEFPGFRGEIQVEPISAEGRNLLAVFYYNTGDLPNIPQLMLIDYKGNIVKRHNCPQAPKIMHCLFKLAEGNEQNLFIANSDGKIEKFNNNLEKTGAYDLKCHVSGQVKVTDLDGNNDPEVLFYTLRPPGILITDKHMKNAVLFKFQNIIINSFVTGLSSEQHRDVFFLMGSDRFFLLKYEKNPLYWISLLLVMAIFSVIYLFILLIRKLQLIQLEKKDQIRSQIVRLQLKSIKGQMDPHFTFNVFSTIAGIIMKESPNAYQPFINFSNLVRNTLESSDKIIRSINEEVTYLENYLELEKIRFPGIFKYKIHLSPEINPEMKIPKMILQTYVENALKHGIRPGISPGIIEIGFDHAGKDLEISITDNGIGRQKAKELNTAGTGFGIKIMEEYFGLFNEFNETKIRSEIIDLADENENPAGSHTLANFAAKCQVT